MSVRFNADADRLERTSDVFADMPYTACGFVQLVNNTGNFSALFSLEESGGSGFHTLKTDSDGVTLRLFIDAPPVTVTLGVLTLGTHYFAAITHDGGTATGYLGVAGSDTPLASASAADVTARAFVAMVLGGSGFNEPGDLRLAGWRVFDAVLTPAELERERRSWHPVRRANLGFHYRFLNAEEKLVDYSGNGFNLSAPGAGTWETEENPPITWRPESLLPSFRALPSVSLTGAFARSTHSVQVGVSGLVQTQSPLLDGDALNATTWTIERLGTGAFLTPSVVRQLDALTFEIQTLEAFESDLVTYRISSTTLLDAVGLPIIPPTQADFLGALAALEATPQAQLVRRNAAARDLANTQTPGSVFQGGTLQVSGGDYANVSGPPLLEKLILRRLLARPGDYYHLPDYGVGLRDKEPVPIPDLAKMKARIEQQILLEPEVSAVRATLTVDPDGLVIVQVHTTQRDGSVLELPAVRQGGVVL